MSARGTHYQRVNENAQEVNVLQFMFAAMWRLTESDPFARKMLVSVAGEYNRRMNEINGKPAQSPHGTTVDRP